MENNKVFMMKKQRNLRQNFNLMNAQGKLEKRTFKKYQEVPNVRINIIAVKSF